MFVDEVSIQVHAGHGGAGMSSFRREKCVPFGGPNGGDGGRGGHVYIRANAQLNTLMLYRYDRIHRARSGQSGGSRNCHGKMGEDLHLEVPVGTLVRDEATGDILADFTEADQEILIARGGRGGFGNVHFKSSVNRAPRESTAGEEGESFSLHLELKLLADVGLVGLPNAGKSTLLSVISAARPKVADYPFTTLHPSLGVVASPDGRASCVVADIPGLIEGASEGIGLGHRFLRHVMRTRLLLHLVALQPDMSSPQACTAQLIEDFMVVHREMALFDETLLSKPYWLLINKCDLYPEEWLSALDRAAIMAACPGVVDVYLFSSITHRGHEDFVASLLGLTAHY